jgi:hypothetical protein
VKDGKVYESEDSLCSFLSFVLNLDFISSIQNLRQSITISSQLLHTFDTIEAYLPPFDASCTINAQHEVIRSKGHGSPFRPSPFCIAPALLSGLISDPVYIRSLRPCSIEQSQPSKPQVFVYLYILEPYARVSPCRKYPAGE